MWFLNYLGVPKRDRARQHCTTGLPFPPPTNNFDLISLQTTSVLGPASLNKNYQSHHVLFVLFRIALMRGGGVVKWFLFQWFLSPNGCPKSRNLTCRELLTDHWATRNPSCKVGNVSSVTNVNN